MVGQKSLLIGLLFYAAIVSPYAHAEGEVRSLKDFQYWDNGKVRQCTVYDAQAGRLKGKIFCAHDGSVAKVEKYDESGNRTEEALYDGKGGLKSGIDGWAAMRWRYDGSHLMWQTTYDDEGRPVEHKLYSESGKLAMRMYRDDDAVNPYVNAAMYMMLGGRNVGYYDYRSTFGEATQLMTE